MLVHEWLAEHESHSIYDGAKAAEAFTKETGKEPPWSTHTAEQIRSAILARGLGGSYNSEVPGVAGFEMAEACARKYIKYHSPKMGRGSMFRDCIERLKEAGI